MSAQKIINETVLATKKFLQGEVDRCGWEALDKSIRCLFADEFTFLNIKGKGVGRETILKFLGGNWKKWKDLHKSVQVFESKSDRGHADKSIRVVFPTFYKKQSK